MSNYILIGIIDFIGGFLIGGAITVKNTTNNTEVALRISNIINGFLLDCIAYKIITAEQEQLITDVLKKRIEKEFKFIKVNSEDK